MREIKFRAWDVFTRSWVSKEFALWQATGVVMDLAVNNRGNLVVEQSTGLRDRNGVEIFEGISSGIRGRHLSHMK